MPVVETDFLKGLIDPEDRLHESCLKAMEHVKKREWMIVSSAFIEFDLLLKHLKISLKDRLDVFEGLMAEIPKESILQLTHESMAQAIQLQKKYSELRDFYFDSIHLGIVILHDGTIVSSDHAFNQVKEVKRLALEKL